MAIKTWRLRHGDPADRDVPCAHCENGRSDQRYSGCHYGFWHGLRHLDIRARGPEGLAAGMSDAGPFPHGGETILNVLHRIVPAGFAIGIPALGSIAYVGPAGNQAHFRNKLQIAIGGVNSGPSLGYSRAIPSTRKCIEHELKVEDQNEAGHSPG